MFRAGPVRIAEEDRSPQRAGAAPGIDYCGSP